MAAPWPPAPEQGGGYSDTNEAARGWGGGGVEGSGAWKAASGRAVCVMVGFVKGLAQQAGRAGGTQLPVKVQVPASAYC